MKQRQWKHIAGVLFAVLYTGWFLVFPSREWPQTVRSVMLWPRPIVNQSVQQALHTVGVDTVTREWRHGAYFFLIMAVVPVVLLAVLGRWRPADFGFRLPNRIAWRVLIFSYIFSLPFNWWMVHSPGFSDPYLSRLDRAGVTAFLAYFLFVFFAEHLYCQGVVLAWCRSDWRWPRPPGLAADCPGGLGRALQWLGWRQPVGDAKGIRAMTRWIGLPDGCLTAVIVGGLLFGAVHLGKDPRELLLSIPGGTALAYIAFRTNSWTVPFALHATNAATSLLMMIVVR